MAQNYPERESKSLEFKSRLPTFSALVKTCVAFANGGGGKIMIGVEDKTCAIVGISEETRHRIYDDFPNSLYDMTSPGLLANIYEQSFDGLSVMIIEITNGVKKPVFIKKEGIPRGVYLRAGSNTRHADQAAVEELLRENKRLYFDEEVIQAQPSILSSDLLHRVLGRVDDERLMREKILALSGVHAQKYCPTVTGILFFSLHPEQYIPEAVIQCTRFSGVEGRDIIQSEEIHGPLDKQVQTSFQLIKSWLLRDYSLFNTRLQAKTIIPEEALREAIINAVIHRKYWIPGAVKMALYDDRLEIFSPGNFPGLINQNHLGDGTTYLRNPHLARIARRFGLVEKLGTGIRLMKDSCRKMGLQLPEFQEGADSVKVIFSFLAGEKSEAADDLMRLFESHKEVRVKDVEQHLKVARNTATRKLNQLISAGKIQRQGMGPAVKYVLTP